MVRTVESGPVGGHMEGLAGELETGSMLRDGVDRRGSETFYMPLSRCGSPLPSSRRQGGCGTIPPGRTGTVQSWITPPAGQQGGLRDGRRQAMEAPSTGPAGHPGRSAVDFGQLLAGVELEVIIHGDVGSQHLQVQSVRVL